MLEVRVEAHDGVARGVVDAGNHGGFVAKVSAEFQSLVRHAFRRWSVEKGPDEGLALVVRAVVDPHHFYFRSFPRAHDLLDGLPEQRQHVLFVEH